MTNLHIKYHGLAVNIISVLHHAVLVDWGNVLTVILKSKYERDRSKEKGWFLHKTSRTNTLKDIAVEILSGQNQCFPLQCRLEMIGIDCTVKFNSKVDASVHVKDGSSFCKMFHVFNSLY